MGVGANRPTRFQRGFKKYCALAAAIMTSTPGVAQVANVAMVYDNLGRLTQATYPGNVVVTFSYDAAGNRTSYTVINSPNPTPAPPGPVGQLKTAPDPATR
jgi:YD repeat-containing protein